MTDFALPITSLTALCAGVLILLLTIRVVQFRRQNGVVLGDGGHPVLAKAIRGHANATEQVPVALILMGLAELQGASATVLGVIAVVLIGGRVLHALYFGRHGTHWRFRFFGMVMTLLAQIGLLLTLAVTLLV